MLLSLAGTTQKNRHCNTMPSRHPLGKKDIVATKSTTFIYHHSLKHYSAIHIRLESKERITKEDGLIEKNQPAKSTTTSSLHILLFNMSRPKDHKQSFLLSHKSLQLPILLVMVYIVFCHEFCGAATCQLC